MIKKIISTLLVIGSVLILILYMFQDKIIFRAEKLPKDHIFSFEQEFEEINLPTKDGELINGLHFKVQAPKGIILFFHGNKGNLSRWGNLVSYLKYYEYDVFVIDYRNYGKSTGKYHEEKMYEDALLAYDYVRQHFSEENIVVYGRSLGCTFATRVAALHNPKHLVLEGSFYNLKRGVRFYSKLAPTFIIKYRFDTHLDIPKVKSPVTFFHGDADIVTSFADSRDLFDLATSKKDIVILPGGTHHNLKDYEMYKEKLSKILD